MNAPTALDEEREQIRAACAAAGPLRVLAALGLQQGARREGSGYKARCPWCHGGKDTPPLSVRVREGQVFAKCFSCDAGGDVFGLVAAVQGLDPRRDFATIRAAAAAIAGLATTMPTPAGYTPHAGTEPPSYPDAGEVQALWAAARRVVDVADAAAYLEGRAIDVGAVDLYDLARVLPPVGALPPWARIQGRTWREAGYRLVVPAFDHTGAMRSLRAWRLPPVPADGLPKRIAPAGKTSAGLVMACPVARHMLSTGAGPVTLVIAEGEPDWLTWASRVSDATEAPAVLGIVAAAWCDAIAARIPDGSRVAIRTQQDPSGQRYAAEIRATLAERQRQQRLTVLNHPSTS